MEINLTTTPKLEALREEVRTWLEENLPKECEGFAWDFNEEPELWAFYRDFWKKQGAMRWMEPDWPSEYGGAEMSRRAARVVNEEFERRRAGDIAGIGMSVGPCILRLGTPEQKRRLLPGMAAGEIMWAEGYTEPNSGSDLASLRTRAELDGDHWVINGQKTFCTAGHHCNWMIIAARTDPDYSKRHNGISYFVTPMDVPGIELQPLYNIADGRQNHVFYDNLRVPAKMMLGGLNQGWTQIWFGLGGDPIPVFAEDDPGPEIDYIPPRTGMAWFLDEVTRLCAETVRQGRPLIEDSAVRKLLAELAVEVEIQDLLGEEEVCQYGTHLHQAITKELQPRLAQSLYEVLGPLAQIQRGKWAPLAGEIDRLYRRSFGNHAGGTSQLKRMVIATRMLGLPR